MLRLILLTTAVLYLTQINGASIWDDVTKTAEKLGEKAIDELFKSLDEAIKIEKESGTLSQQDLSIIECVKFLKYVKDAKEGLEKAINDTRVLVDHFIKEAEGRMEECIKTQTVLACHAKEKLEELRFEKRLNDYSKMAKELPIKIQNSFNECKKLISIVKTSTTTPSSRPSPSYNFQPVRLPNIDTDTVVGTTLAASAVAAAWGIISAVPAMLPAFIPLVG